MNYMKKFLAVFMTIVLMMSFTCALAEEVKVQQSPDAFDVTLVVPEGYEMKEERINDALYINVISATEDESVCEYFLSIAFSEEHDGRSMADLSQEEKDALIATFNEGYENATQTEMTTKEGSQIFLLDENNSESDYALAFTIYKGYFIQMFISKPNFETLTEENIALANEIFGDLHFKDI
ncbi:MAG: hypothetical protein RR696_03610 [Clostridia bacterium]